MPSQIDVFQLTPKATDEDVNLCVEWIKTQLRAQQTVSILVKRCQKQELIPQITVDMVTMIQQKLKQLSNDPQTRQNEVQELLQVYNQKGVKNQSLLIQIYIELANVKAPDAQEKAIELLCKVDEKIRKQFSAPFSQFLKEKTKQLIDSGTAETNQQHHQEALNLFLKAQELNSYYEEKNTTIQLNVALGNAYNALKKSDDALVVWEKAIKLIQSESLQDSFQNELIFMYYTVGQICYEKKQNNKAIQYWESAINLLEQQNEVNQLEQQSKQLLGHLLNNVGMIYYQKGEVKKAISNFQKTIEVYETIYGKDDIKVGNRLNNLGEAYRSDKQYDKALEMFYKALSIKKAEASSQPSKSLANTINNVGMTLQNKQNYEEAIEYFKQALQIQNEPGVFSDPNAGNAALQKSNTMHSIAECYRALHNLDLCIQYFREAYKYKSQELKIYHKSTQHTAIQLASALFQKCQFDESLKIFEEVLDGQRQVYGQDSQIVAQTINCIGTVLSEQKQYDSALEKVQEAIKILEKKMDKNDPYLQKVYENLKSIKQRISEQGTSQQ